MGFDSDQLCKKTHYSFIDIQFLIRDIGKLLQIKYVNPDATNDLSDKWTQLKRLYRPISVFILCF